MPSFCTDTPAETIVCWAGWKEYDEPVEASEARTVSGPVGCGWFGAKGRATSDATACLTLMGGCLYKQVTGNSTSTAPAVEGNATRMTAPQSPSTSQILMAKSGTGNAHGAEFQSDGEEITEKSLLGLSMQGQSCWGFRVVHQLFAVHSWELQLVLVDTPRGMLEYGGGIGSALALRMRWLGSRILQWALLPVARAGD